MKNKIFKVLLLVLVSALVLCSCTKKMDEKDGNYYVCDETNTITNETKAAITSSNAELQKEKNSKVFYVITKNLNNVSAKDFINNELKKRNADNNDSGYALFLIVSETNNYYISLNETMQQVISKSEIETMFREKIDTPFQSKDYNTVISESYNWIRNKANGLPGKDTAENKASPLLTVIVVILVILVLFALFAIVLRTVNIKKKKRKSHYRRSR